MDKANDKSKKLILLESLLRAAAVLILKKYKPQIVGITGSVGKTSAKEAIFSVLSAKFNVRKNEKNYNNEIGLPLTIIGVESGEDSIFGWLKVFLKTFAVIIFPIRYPEILILEMGADRPGDLQYLTSFIGLTSGVITDISGSHLEFFKTLEGVAKEKWTLVENVLAGGICAVNIDNPMIYKYWEKSRLEGRDFLTFGFSEKADINAQEIFFNYESRENNLKKEVSGIAFKLNYKGTSMPIRLKNVLGSHMIYAAMSAVAIGIIFKMNLVEIAEALGNFSVLPGRMKLIEGIKNSSIIDDTYNSSPVSCLAALEVLQAIDAPRKIAVMGDMLELGSLMEEGHRRVGEKFHEIGGDIFFAVGKRMRFAVEALDRHNIAKNKIFVFENPQEAGNKLREILEEGDLILVKGSQGMRMEKVVERVMAEPQKAGKLLCRQSENWKNKEWREV